MIASLFLAFGQITDPAFRSPLFKAGGLAALGFLALVGVTGWGVGELAGGTGWIATIASALGTLLALFAAVWLFVPVMLAIAGLFMDGVAEAVERRHYPDLPPARGAPLLAQGWANVTLGLRVLLLMLLALPLALLLPVIGAVALWAIAAVSLGDGLFEGVAQRRMSVPESRALRRRRRLEVWALGGVLAAMAAVPMVNLLVPVIGTAAMTHLLQRGPRAPTSGAAEARPTAAEASGPPPGP